jgi:hypothetical protein
MAVTGPLHSPTPRLPGGTAGALIAPGISRLTFIVRSMPIGGTSGAIADISLLDLLEPGWRRQLAAGAPAGRIDVEPGIAQAAAAALGEQSRNLPPGGPADRWPACVVVALARVAAAAGPGSFWPAWHRAAGLRRSRRSAGEWGSAFLTALATLGLPATGSTADDAVLAHAAARRQGSEGESLDEGERGDGAEEEGGAAGLRLDPFGGGIMRVDTASGQARPVPPEDLARDGDRLLVFDTDGAPAAGVLPPEAVWAVCPVSAELRSDVPLRTLVTSTLPLTWRGWRLVQLDLREASWLALRDTEAHAATQAGPHADGERRVVRGRTKPVLRTGLPVAGLLTTTGKPVFACPPEVLLPPGRDRWRVEARRARTGVVLASVTATGDAWRPDALWRNVPRPLLGEFTITVTTGTVTTGTVTTGTVTQGTVTPGLRRGVVLAEGLGVTSYPVPRLTSPHGLEPAEAVISAPPGMTVSPAAVEYQEDTLTRPVTCVAGPVVQQLAVTPPHIRLRVEPEPGSGGTATGWHHAGPLRLTSDDLWRGGALRIDLPGVAVPPPVTVTARSTPETGGKPVQVLDPTRDGRYPLRRILDTVTAYGRAELTIKVAAAPVTIATVSGTSQVNDPWAMSLLRDPAICGCHRHRRAPEPDLPPLPAFAAARPGPGPRAVAAGLDRRQPAADQGTGA